MYRTSYRRNTMSTWEPILVGGTLAVLVVLFVAFAVRAFHTDHYTGIVDSKSWSREVPVEQWMEVQEEGWDVPATGTIVSTERKFHHYDRVACGTDTRTINGTPTSETRYCDDPVYRTWYVYRIWKWVHVRSFTASGGADDPPTWPDTSDINNTHAVNPERLGAPKEAYLVVFSASNGQSYTLPFTQAIWEGMHIETAYDLEVDWRNRVINVTKEKH
jgi:hypothetical protein